MAGIKDAELNLPTHARTYAGRQARTHKSSHREVSSLSVDKLIDCE